MEGLTVSLKRLKHSTTLGVELRLSVIEVWQVMMCVTDVVELSNNEIIAIPLSYIENEKLSIQTLVI